MVAVKGHGNGNVLYYQKTWEPTGTEIVRGSGGEVPETKTFGVCLYVQYALCQRNHACCNDGNMTEINSRGRKL